MKPALFGSTLLQPPVWWALCVTEKEFHATLKGMGVAREDWPLFVSNSHSNATTHFFTKDGRQRAVITVRVDPHHTTEEIYALLAHEAVHVWQEIRDNIGERKPSAEFEAYSVQGICIDLFCWYRDKTKKKGKK